MLKVARLTTFFAAFVLAACAAIQQQHSQPVRADQGEFKNLKVLPQNISHDELLATMRSFTQALGRRCDFCHVATPGGPEEFDFASDAKDHKRIARAMILMTRDANADVQRVAKQEDEKFPQMTCWTCHRGAVHPQHVPPAPAAPAAAPQPQP